MGECLEMPPNYKQSLPDRSAIPMEPDFSSESEHNHNEIVISSSCSPPMVGQPNAPIGEIEEKNVELQLVNPHPNNALEEEQRQMTSVSNAKAIFEELQEKERRELEANRDIREKVKQRERERQQEKQLRKEFESHSFLPTPSLQNVKKKLAEFPQRFKMEALPKDEAPYAATRLQHRKLLFRVMLLAIEELRTKVFGQKTQLQSSLVEGSVDELDFCFKLASELECTFFRVLKKQIKEQYRKQIKLVIREFSDKNNIEFRRNVLNSRLNLKELARVDEEALKCDKTKEEDRQRMLQLIRESQKDPIQIHQEPMEEEEQPPEMYRMGSFQSVPSFSSRMDIEEDREEQRKREREEMRGLVEKVEAKAREILEKRRERTRVFLQGHIANQSFKKVCDSVGL